MKHHRQKTREEIGEYKSPVIFSRLCQHPPHFFFCFCASLAAADGSVFVFYSNLSPRNNRPLPLVVVVRRRREN